MRFSPVSLLSFVILALAGASAVAAAPTTPPTVDCDASEPAKRSDHVENCWL
ncbi:hypothetical protein GY45DRAFT_1329842 [Cubamyces sp. BRFM 1775]|nr:hypothetical protein GY45DRAFT_1329842 [Cubamyces sp. BRFM 1775]